MTLSFYKKIYKPFYSLKGVKNSVVLERQAKTNGNGGRRRQTTIMTHDFFS